MGTVAGVDTLGAISRKEVGVEQQPRYALYHRQTLLLGDTRIDGALIHHDVAFPNGATHHFGCRKQWGEIGTVVVVDGRRHRHDVHVAAFYLLFTAGATHAVLADGLLQHIVIHLAGVVMPLHEGLHATLPEVVTHHGKACGEKACQWEPHIAESHDTYPYII